MIRKLHLLGMFLFYMLFSKAYASIVNISGKLYNDGGNSSPLTATNGGGSLYANLINNGSGKVVQSVAIGTVPTGTYSFTNVDNTKGYSIMLTQTQYTVGQNAPSSSEFNNGWISTFGDVSINAGFANSVNIDYALDQLPTTDAYNNPSVPNGAFTYSANYKGSAYSGIANNNTNIKPLSGTDAEDCATTSSCNAHASFSIGNIASNTLLVYNSDTLTPNESINDFIPSEFVIYGKNGSPGPFSFTYALIDAAGYVSHDFVTYSINATNVLPVKLAFFNAVGIGDNIVLKWQTLEETNVAEITIQRSVDAVSFSTLSSLHPNGPSVYVYVDNQPIQGANYYRLAIVDKDGSKTYSNIISIIMTSSTFASMIVYPNPIANNSKVVISGIANFSSAYLTIINSVGQTIQKKQVLQSVTNADFDALPHGIYHLLYTDAAGNQLQTKVVK